MYIYKNIPLSLSLALSVFLSHTPCVSNSSLADSGAWSDLGRAHSEASGTAGPSFIISIFSSHLPVHSVQFHFGDKQKYSTNRNYIYPLSLIFIRVRILANLFHV